MNTIINFEFKKFIHNKKNIILIALFAICVFIFLYVSNLLDDSLLNNEIKVIEMNIDENEKFIIDLQKYENENPDSLDKNVDYMDEYNRTKNVLSDMIQHIRNNDRLALVVDKIEYNNLLIERFSHPGDVSESSFIVTIKEETDLLSYLKDHKLEEINEQASIKADNAIILLLGYPAILIIIIAVFMCADAISSEFDNKTSYILFTQPVKKGKIFFSKFITSSLLITLIFSLFFIILYFVLNIIKGGLQFNYPYKYYNGNNISLIPAISFIILSFVLLFLIIFFVISFTFFISSIFKNTFASASVTTIIIFLFYILSSKGFFGNFAHLLPFSYFNITSIINGEASQLYSNTDVIFINGVIILTVSILILMSSSFIVFKNNIKNI